MCPDAQIDGCATRPQPRRFNGVMTMRIQWGGLCVLALWAATAYAQEVVVDSDPSFISEAITQPPPVESRPTLEDLYQRINSMQAELDTIRSTPPRPGLEEGRLRSSDVPRIEDVRQNPTYPKVKLTGFFQADAGYFGQNAASMAMPEFGNIHDTAGFRRARLAAVGDVAENVSYILEMDFAFPGRPSFMDVWLDIHNIALLGNVRIGQWRQPFGMDNLTSVRELQFLERPLSFAFAPFRQIGIGFHDTSANQNVTWAFSGFRFPTDTFGGVGNPIGAIGTPYGDRGYGAAGRITAVPYYDECGFVLHLGADYSYLYPGTDFIRFRNTPEFGGPFLGNQGLLSGTLGNLGAVPFFVDTRLIPTHNVNLYNAELGMRLGSWYSQSEATYAVVQPLGGGAAMNFASAYAQMGYFLTGEVRSYNKQGGVFGRVKPNNDFGMNGWGALEVCTRYSYIDLNSGTVNGGRLNDVTFGINWYLNQYTKFQMNYIHAYLDREPVGRSDTDIVAFRAQVDF